MAFRKLAAPLALRASIVRFNSVAWFLLIPASTCWKAFYSLSSPKVAPILRSVLAASLFDWSASRRAWNPRRLFWSSERSDRVSSSLMAALKTPTTKTYRGKRKTILLRSARYCLKTKCGARGLSSQTASSPLRGAASPLVWHYPRGRTSSILSENLNTPIRFQYPHRRQTAKAL